MTNSIEAVFELRDVTSDLVTSAFDIEVLGRLFSTCVLDGTPLTIEEASDVLRTSRSDSFDLFNIGETSSISLAAISDHRLSFVSAKNIGDVNSIFDQVVNKFCGVKGFLSARSFDRQYERLQNATSLGPHKNAGVDIRTLQMVSNGLPYPLEQEIVDISQNPGRRVLRNGFVEAIGPTMRFSSSFLTKIAPKVDRLRELGAVSETKDWIQFSVDGIFDESEQAAELQDSVRGAVFGTNPVVSRNSNDSRGR